MKKLRWLLLLLPFGMFAGIALKSTQFAGGEDGVMHHLIARYAPEHPANLLDHWGKPLYITLSFPFAQFGFYGSVFFNILLAILCAGMLWKTAENLGLTKAWLAPVLLLFSTIYFYSVTSSITEILFSFLLAWGLLLASRHKWVWAAVVISFLPFARSEGNGIIVAWLIGFIMLQQWKAIPFLATGTLLYSLAGWPVYDDFFWVWNMHPYTDASAIYGSGDLFHYVKKSRQIWGNVLYALWIAGSFVFLYRFIRVLGKKEKADKSFYVWLFFVFGSFYIYLVGHSLVWYMGKSASFGLIRVMAAIMPACVLMAMLAFDRFLGLFNPRLKLLFLILPLLLAFSMIQSAFVQNRPPYNGDKEREEILKAAEWYRNSPYYGEKHATYYFAPSVAEAFEIDPFDSEQRKDLSQFLGATDVKPGTLIVWDAHFGPNECHLPVDSLKQRKDLELIYHQEPEEEMRTLNDYKYEIYLFRKRE